MVTPVSSTSEIYYAQEPEAKKSKLDPLDLDALEDTSCDFPFGLDREGVPLVPAQWKPPFPDSAFPVYNVPRDVALLILNHLPIKELVKITRVCKLWQHFVFNLSRLKTAFSRELFPKEEFPVEVIDASLWKIHFNVDLTDEPPIDGATLAVLADLHARLKIDGNAGVTLLTLPKEMTLEKFIGLLEQFLGESPISFIWDRALKILGKKALGTTCRVAITNNVITETRRKYVADQRRIVKEHGGELLGTLPAAILIVLTKIKSNTHLYSRLNRTRCAEKIGGWQVIVSTSRAGLLRIDSSYDHSTFDGGNSGAGGMFMLSGK